MKLLYLDLGMGAAGDMLTAALAELLADKDAFLAQLNGIGLPGVSVAAESSVKCGITGTHIRVRVNGVEEDEMLSHDHGGGHDHHDTHHEDYDHDHHDAHHEGHDHDHHDAHHEGHNHDHGGGHDHAHHHGGDCHHAHHHSSLADIRDIIDRLAVSDKVRADALAVYTLIAEAEGRAHGKPVGEIHFHEVGAMDAVADVVAVCMLMERIAPEKVVASPVHVGSGHVRCAHGILPVPAPATAYILQGVPTYGGEIRGELCTPTGAALLKYFVSEYGAQPPMVTQAIGYGMGRKDFEAANCVRAMLGEDAAEADAVCELSCNVDDMTAERIAFAMERFFEAGAREVYTQPVGMKKNRPGTLIHVLCAERDTESMVRQIFKYTTTIGVREAKYRRYVLERTVEAVQTPWGAVRRKSCCGYGVTRVKYEYDDLARIAKEQGMSLEEVEAQAGRRP